MIVIYKFQTYTANKMMNLEMFLYQKCQVKKENLILNPAQSNYMKRFGQRLQSRDEINLNGILQILMLLKKTNHDGFDIFQFFLNYGEKESVTLNTFWLFIEQGFKID